MNTKPKSYRLTEATTDTIATLARRWRCSHAKAIARAVSMISVEDGQREHLRQVAKDALQEALRKITRDGV